MPRKAKPSPGPGSGGPRVGTVGQAYSNRTDLNPGTQAIKTAPGQPYGVAQQQAQAQKAMPLPTGGPTAPLGAPAPPPGAPTPPPPGADPTAGGIPPGGHGDLMRPTERPQEPVTTGAPFGPGPGPEVLNPQKPDPLVQASAVLNSLGDNADADTKRLMLQINAHLNNQLQT